MILSRSKPALNTGNDTAGPSKNPTDNATNLPRFEDYLRKRDYTGAITLLEFKQYQESNLNNELWIAYCAFHRGDYKKALESYQSASKLKPDTPDLALNIACCYFYLGMYEESREAVQKASACGLKTRLNFHLSHKLRDEQGLMDHHQQLQDVLEDQLSLAAIHYLRAHYQEAIDIYKRLLAQNRENLALNVYVALCYYKLDYYDVSQEVLGLYLNQYPDSVIATNLKACNHFRLYNGTGAENELKSIIDHTANVGFGYDLVRHNLVVFRGGEGAMQVFPGLVDVVPEARLNLVIHHLKNGDTKEAFNLMKDVQPTVPQEYILKGVVNATLGQEIHSSDHLKTAEECFHLVGSSTSECDTIHGRECMAATFFLNSQFEEVLVYLTSIKSYLHSDDTFNYNLGQALSLLHRYPEACEALLLVSSPTIQSDPVYLAHIARAYVMTGRPQQAWELYLRTEASSDAFNLLLLVANDCYRMGHFWHAAKAFDMLERLEPGPEFWEGKRGAVVGVLQGVIANKFPADMLGDVLQLLRNSSNSQAEQITKVIRKWAKEKRLNFS